MIPAKKNSAFVKWFTAQTVKRITKMFSKVYIRGDKLAAETLISYPCLFVSNHTSWWDPMFSIYLGHELFKADAFAMMDAANLEKLPFLGRIGGFGVYLNKPADGRRALKYAADILDRPGRMVWIFPEGAERPRAEGTDEFKPGAAVTAKWAQLENIFPVGLRYVFCGREHPEAYISIGEPLNWSDDIDSNRIAQQNAVLEQLEIIDKFVRDRSDQHGFVLKIEAPISKASAFAEKMLAFLTRYDFKKLNRTE